MVINRIEPITAPRPRADCRSPKPCAPTRKMSLAKIVRIALSRPKIDVVASMIDYAQE